MALKWGLFLFGFVFILPSVEPQGVSAVSLGITIPDSLSVSVTPSAEGTVAESSTAKLTVSSDAPWGYTLSIKSTNGSNSLVNGSNSITSIGTETADKNNFTKNSWGFKFTGGATINDNYRPGPTGSLKELDKTSGNGQATVETDKEYGFTIAAKVDNTIATGTYTGSFTFTAVANEVSYAISFDANGGTGEPDAISGNTQEKTVALSKKVPTKNSENFIGWCTAIPTNENVYDEDTCPEGSKAYKEGDALDLASSNNTVTLHAMWQKELTIEKVLELSGKEKDDSGHYKMQDMSAELCSHVGTFEKQSTATLVDIRDDNTYKVRKLKDDRCWMVDNLRIDNATLTSTDSDVRDEFVLPASNIENFNIESVNEKRVYIDQTYGGFYNLFTATAGEATTQVTFATIQQSICPKGWNLPDNTEYKALVESYDENQNILLNIDGPNFMLSGDVYIYNGQSKRGNIGTHGVFWTSSIYDSKLGYNMLIYSNKVAPYDTIGRHRGNAIRCISD